MADIGTTLREARMRARIDITEIERRTKIRAKYLRAMENEEWDLLPGPIYVKSFLKTYADDLGLDSRLLLDEFRRRYEGPSDHDLRPMSGLGRERDRDRPRGRPTRRGPLVPSWAIVGLVLAVVVVVLYLIGSKNNSPKTTPVTTRVVTHPRHHVHVTSPAPPVVPPKSHPALTTVDLQLVPTGAVYVCAVSSTGQVLIPQNTFEAGETIPAAKAKALYLTLGTNAVTMTVNGKPYTVAASAGAIDLKVTPTGVAPFTPGQGPSCT